MKKIKDAILLWLANFFTGMLSLVGKIYPIKIANLHYLRAHFLVNTEYWLRTNRTPSRGLKFFVLGKKPWNRQILLMIKRKVLVVESDFLYRLLVALQNRKPESDVWIPLCESGHFRHIEWNSLPQQLVLNEEEQNRGRRNLKEMGIGDNEPIICFFSRGDRYIKETVIFENVYANSYRNSNIENYLKAIQWLTTKGYRALRMGALVERRLTTINPKIIDYASKCRSDFMDVFLISYCRFVVGDTAGIITIAYTFNTPYIEVNVVPLAHLPRSKNALCILKKYKDKRTGRILTFREIFQREMDMYMNTKQFDDKDIELIENSPEEIADVTMEMHLRLEGEWQQTSEDDRLQERFRALIPQEHQVKGFPSRVGAAFLRNNQELLN